MTEKDWSEGDPERKARIEESIRIIEGMSPEERAVYEEQFADWRRMLGDWLDAEGRARRTVGGLIHQAMKIVKTVSIDRGGLDREQAEKVTWLLRDAMTLLGFPRWGDRVGEEWPVE
jgi:hypothetical protein